MPAGRAILVATHAGRAALVAAYVVLDAVPARLAILAAAHAGRAVLVAARVVLGAVPAGPATLVAALRCPPCRHLFGHPRSCEEAADQRQHGPLAQSTRRLSTSMSGPCLGLASSLLGLVAAAKVGRIAC